MDTASYQARMFQHYCITLFSKKAKISALKIVETEQYSYLYQKGQFPASQGRMKKGLVHSVSRDLSKFLHMRSFLHSTLVHF